jgi:two-component system, cell cycle sensor histidine kinase and response regulator CckA
MTSQREPSQSEQQPLQLLWVGREEQRVVLQDYLRSSVDLAAAPVDQASCFEEVTAKLAQRVYDLLVFGQREPEAEEARIIQELRLQGRKAPLLFLHGTLAKTGGVESDGQSVEGCGAGAAVIESSLIRTIRGAVTLGRAEQQRREVEDTFRTLYSAIEQSADMVLITDSSGTIEYVNPAFEKLTGYARPEVIGQTPRLLKSGEQGPEHYRELWATIAAGEIYRGVLVNRKKTGESFVVEKTITPVRNTAGRVTHFISNDRDISERRRLEAALFQAQKMDAIGLLAGGVAHDFNNLLLVISSYAELMQDSIGPEHRLHRNVQEILSAARRAADLTRQLLAFGRKQMQSLQVLDLNAILRDISRMLPRLIGEDVELIIAPQNGLDKVKLDPVQLEQVVMNLVANARDAMPTGGKLTIATHNVELTDAYVQARPVVPPGSYVMLEVTDTGQGIDAEHLPHIFEPFYTTKEQGKGTGLGLATVYGIVKQSGGFIWVYSELGMGTTFKVYFPRIVHTRKVASVDTPVAATDLRGSETLLLVEDESAVRHPACEFLRQCGYTVIEARDGLHAVEAVDKHPGRIHLMVTDVVMPGMSGGQLAELLAEKYSDMKVLFVSGYSEKIVLRHQILDVQTNFLQKPFTLKSLAAKIREVLGHGSAAAGAGY